LKRRRSTVELMKHATLILVLVIAIPACDRESEAPRQEVLVEAAKSDLPREAQSRTVPLSAETLREKGLALALKRDGSKMIPDESLKELEKLAPALLDADVLREVIREVPIEQLSGFKEPILASVEKIIPGKEDAVHRGFLGTVNLARDLHSKELPHLLFEHLTTVPPYAFPESDPEVGWGRGDHALEYSRGPQGVIAKTVVGFGDSEVMARYRELIKSADPQLKRIMAWGLGNSADMEDFDYLWDLRKATEDAGMKETIMRALNKIPITMSRVARYPVIGGANRSGRSPAELEEDAAACRVRLEDEGLTVRTTIWD